MTLRLCSLSLVVSLLFVQITFSAEPEKLSTQAQAIVEKINTRLKAGSQSKDDFKPEIAEFDALIAAHRSEKTNEVAGLIMTEASFFLEVFHDTDSARKLLLILQKEFPKTEAAAEVDEMLASLKIQAAAEKIQATLTPGSPFPDFREKDSAGRPLSISALKGRVVLVDFWATWCPPCREQIPHVVALYEQFHKQGLEVVGISLDKDLAKMKAYTEQNKMPWPQYFDGLVWKNKISEKYGVIEIPQTFLLDRSGRIIAQSLLGDQLTEAVQKAIAAP